MPRPFALVQSSHASSNACQHRIRTVVRRVASVFMLLSFAVAGVSTAASGLTDSARCEERDTARVLAPWLDPANYFLASNGGFEHDVTDWVLRGSASIVPENESFNVGDGTDSHSLRLDAGATAQARTACIGMGEPTIRMFVNATVRHSTVGLALTTRTVFLSGVSANGWMATPPILMPNLLGGVVPEELTLRLTSQGGTWLVDDYYIDPFKSR